MKQILADTQTTSDEYHAGGNRYSATVILTNHAGGTWTLEVEAPDGTWVDPESVQFTKNDVFSNVIFERGLNYRLTGGSVGATAWVSEQA